MTDQEPTYRCGICTTVVKIRTADDVEGHGFHRCLSPEETPVSKAGAALLDGWQDMTSRLGMDDFMHTVEELAEQLWPERISALQETLGDDPDDQLAEAQYNALTERAERLAVARFIQKLAWTYQIYLEPHALRSIANPQSSCFGEPTLG